MHRMSPLLVAMKLIPALAFALQVIACHAQTVDVWFTAGTLSRPIVAEARRTARGAVLLFDAGDLLRDERTADAAAELAYDALIPADRDLSQGLAPYAALLARSRATGISANVISKDVRNLVPCRIWEVNGVRIGLTGVVSPRFAPLAADPQKALASLMPGLREAVDVTLVVVHASWDDALELARTVPGIDVVVAAHAGAHSETVGKTLVVAPSEREVCHLEVSAGDRTRQVRATMMPAR